MPTKRIIVAVTNDLITDQRVHKVCLFLKERGHMVCLVGRKKRDSRAMDPRSYTTRRMKLLFEKGALFYAAFNFRLLLRLIFSRADIIVANDLDTLMACSIAAKLKGAKLVYDSHEYFTEVPELQHRPAIRRIWERIEQRYFPKADQVITVNASIASLYEKKYGRSLHVVRNIPSSAPFPPLKSRAELGLPEEKKIIIIQGAGINIHRGNEEMLRAMCFIPDALLLIIGNGDVVEQLKKETQQLSLSEKVRFFPRMPYGEMMQFTRNSDLGITLDKDNNLNYRFSLPNKIFDFIRAGIPVMASDLPEVKNIVNSYHIGQICPSHQPEIIAEHINRLFSDTALYAELKANTQTAARELSWENECQVLEKVYSLLKA